MSTVVPESGKAIDVKKAVQIARESIVTLFESEIRSDVRLEEVAISENHEDWLITMSFLQQVQRDDKNRLAVENELIKSILPSTERAYKRVTISAADGNVKAVNIRSVTE